MIAGITRYIKKNSIVSWNDKKSTSQKRKQRVTAQNSNNKRIAILIGGQDERQPLPLDEQHKNNMNTIIIAPEQLLNQ